MNIGSSQYVRARLSEYTRGGFATAEQPGVLAVVVEDAYAAEQVNALLPRDLPCNIRLRTYTVEGLMAEREAAAMARITYDANLSRAYRCAVAAAMLAVWLLAVVVCLAWRLYA